MINIIAVLLLLFGVSIATDANSATVDLPNLKKTATGTDLGGGKFGLDVSLPPGAVTVDGGKDIGQASVIPGDKGLTILGLRKDSTGSVTGVADGDYGPFQLDADGNLKTVGSTVNKTQVDDSYNDYTVTPVTTGAWVELIASTPVDITEAEIFDSSGQMLELGVGAASSEVRVLYVAPGGNGRVPLVIPSGSRISIRAVTGTANVGFNMINFFE
jgi:hypothetical protein